MSDERSPQDDEWTPEAVAEVNQQVEEVFIVLRAILTDLEFLNRLREEHPSPPKSAAHDPRA